MVSSEILTAAETAALLRVDKKTVQKLANYGELPGRKVGRVWRFHRGEVEDWVRGKYDLGARVQPGAKKGNERQ